MWLVLTEHRPVSTRMNCKLKVKFEVSRMFPHHRNVSYLHFSKVSNTNSLTQREKKLLKYNMWPKKEAVKRAGDQNKKKHYYPIMALPLQRLVCGHWAAELIESTCILLMDLLIFLSNIWFYLSFPSVLSLFILLILSFVSFQYCFLCFLEVFDHISLHKRLHFPIGL